MMDAGNFVCTGIGNGLGVLTLLALRHQTLTFFGGQLDRYIDHLTNMN